ncbi:MAG: class I SAM-dependent methyltransferase [Bacilli bacterium]|nr:class I SAM-dependent methyltransferase [Bacilli bacterium]
MQKKYFELGSAKNNILGKKVLENNYDYDDNKYVYDENRKNDGHSAVVRQINNNSVVLDIGCASGILGTILTKYKNCIVDGIEYDKKAYEVCKKKNIYRNLYNFSISNDKATEYIKFDKLNLKYDYIIFADVLEHLANPYEVLANVSKYLKKDGAIIVCIPNISHIDIIKSIIEGNFNYNRHGILDSTHLRFFTNNSFLDMIENIESEYNIFFDVKHCERILFKPPYFDDLNLELFNLDGNLEDYLTLQNVYKISLTNVKKKKKLDVVKHDDYFEKMLNQYNNMNEELKKLKNDNQILKNDNQELKEELSKIVNSKRWKMLNKMLKIVNK